MNKKQFVKKIKMLIPEYREAFNMIETGSIVLSKLVEPKEFRDHSKNLYKVDGERTIFISDLMYKDRNDMPHYHYMVIATKAQIRYYRAKKFVPVELDKEYFSGQNYSELFLKVKRAVQTNFV